MSSSGQTLGGIVGGIAGFFLTGGSVQGAVYGAQLGASIGTAIDPPKGPTIRAPRLEDLSAPDYRLGTPIARLHGTCGIACQMGWVENNAMKETVRSQEQGGKGGGGQTVETVSYSVTCAMHGPDIEIAGVNRVWVSGQLTAQFNPADTSVPAINPIALVMNNAMLARAIGSLVTAESLTQQQFAVYTGAADQLPDPRFEADVTNAPAWRGMGTLVFYDWDLKAQGNSLMAFAVKAEFISEGTPTVSSVGVLYSYGPGYNSIVSSGGGDLLLTGYAHIGIVNEFPYDVTIDQKISPTGEIFATNLEGDGLTDPNFTQYFDVDSDVPGIAYRKAGADANNIFVPGVGDITSPANRSTNWHLLSRGGVARFIAPGVSNTTVYDEAATALLVTSDYTLFAMINAQTMIAIANNGETIRTFDADDLSTIDTFTLDTPFPDPSGNSLDGYGSYACATDGSTFWVLDVISGDYLVWDVGAELEIDRGMFPAITNPGLGGQKCMLQVRGNALALFRRGSSFSNPSRVQYFTYGVSTSGPTLQSVVSTELQQNETVTASDIDVTGLTGNVKGMLISGKMTANNILAPLKYRYMFDVFGSGYKIKAQHRGQAVGKTIPWEDLGAVAGNGAAVDAVITEREMDHMLPTQIAVGYLDPARNYDRNEQLSYDRDTGQTANKQTIDLPLVGSATEMVTVADQLMDIGWHERINYQFTLPGTYRDLEPCDVVDITDPSGRYYRMRLTTVEMQSSGVIACGAVREKADLYTQSAEGDGGIESEATIDIALDSLAVFLDIPLINAADDTLGFGVAVVGATDPWQGATLWRSPDAEQTWTAVRGFTGEVTIAQHLDGDVLGESDGAVIDRTNTLNVSVLGGELSSITEAQMVAGGNLFAYGAPGRWEIIQFTTATLTGTGRYLLSGFARGQKGTEWATGTHRRLDYLVDLGDTDIGRIAESITALSLERYWRCVTNGQRFDFVSSTTHTYNGVNLKPLSPVLGEAVLNGSGDWVFTWVRRSRFDSSWWTTGTPAQNETTESYEVDILNGADVVRTISASSETATYTAAQQTADFGSGQASITVKIYQLNPTVGRGYDLEVTG